MSSKWNSEEERDLIRLYGAGLTYLEMSKKSTLLGKHYEKRRMSLRDQIFKLQKARIHNGQKLGELSRPLEGKHDYRPYEKSFLEAKKPRTIKIRSTPTYEELQKEDTNMTAEQKEEKTVNLMKLKSEWQSQYGPKPTALKKVEERLTGTREEILVQITKECKPEIRCGIDVGSVPFRLKEAQLMMMKVRNTAGIGPVDFNIRRKLRLGGF